jgi:hypothetical protein
MSVTLPLRIATAAALGVVAFAHLDVADTYTAIGDRPLSLGDQFYAQSAVAIALGVVLLALAARPLPRLDALVWAATAAFGAVSLGALVYSRYNTIPVPGFEGGFSETWEAPRAVLSAWSEGVVIVLALLGLVLALRERAGSRGDATARV